MKKLIQILPFFLLFQSAILYSQAGKDSYSNSSVLSSGEWYKIGVTTDGIYRIDYSDIKQLGLGNPSNPKIFSNNFGQLSYYNDDTKPDDLKEVAIYTHTGSDGIFNEGDYILFFGEGTNRWIYNSTSGDYDFIKHNYSDTAFYFITSGTTPGKRIISEAEPSNAANYFSSESDALYIHEKDTKNLIQSGREWFQPISTINGIVINPGFTDILTYEDLKYEIRVAARASIPTIFRFCEGESVKNSILVPGVNIFNTTGTYAQIVDSSGSVMPGSVSPQYEIKFYNNGEAGAEGYIDRVKLKGRKSNIFYGPAMQYFDSRSVAPGRVTQFTITCLSNDSLVWDISDPLNIKKIKYKKTGNNITFKATTDTLKKFIAFSPMNVLTPVIKLKVVPNQNLHASDPADMIIITHPLFMVYAHKLANIHFKNSGLISLIVTPEHIYNEFSGGIPDIAAIRNFVRMKYLKQKGSSHPLLYLLLFGDGSFENKTLPPDNPNFIPTYQSENSNVVVSSFTSDDFYGLLEDGEGEADGTEDIGIGRLPVSDTIQASDMISKILGYIDPANMGNWKNIICITADDEDGNTHMSDAEGLSSLLQDSVPTYNVEKIYLDAYKQTTNVNGQSYPDVNKAINKRINSGCLIFNYLGHGSERELAKEQIIKIEDINSWNNSSKLPLFITATCEFSRFDDVDFSTYSITGKIIGRTSAGELVLLNKNGGAIALMSTTRVVYSAPNYFLNRNIYNTAFEKDEDGNSLRLGDIIRIAKNKTGNGPNKRNFTLLGDPAIKLAYPWYGNVVTDSINNVSVSEKTDSLKALSVVNISGHVEDNSGNIANNFNGIVYPLLFDKASKIKTLANDGGPVMEFSIRNNIIFSGKTMATNGRFRYTFIVPRDIDYSFGTGKISYYANSSSQDMNGYFAGLIVGGFSKSIIPDTSGPEIELFMNDTLFKNWGITDSNPRLLAIIQDQGGINTTGSGIGHDLTGYLDDNPNISFSLNSYFENDFDNYMKGRVNYNLSGLTEGSHALTLKAWDNFNNSSVKTIHFLVATDRTFILKNLLNYPNPFFSLTRISAEHNRPESEMNVIISVYNLDGRIIKMMKTKVLSTGYTLPPITWDGNDDRGKKVARGIYPYTVTVTTEKGETTRSSGRMIIL